MSFLNLKGTYEAINLDWDIMTGQFKTGAFFILTGLNAISVVTCEVLL